MTKQQLAKLHTILAKLETLESEISDGGPRDRLATAKAELLRAVNEAERASRT
jgi:hypothetical protein